MKTVSFLRKPLGFEGKFTQIPNTWARDERLGYRAKGILLLLMSHQDGWKISLEHLAGDGPDGITAVRTAISQLQELGYLKRNQIRNSKNQIEGSEWIISDPFEPESENLMLENQTENLMLENLTLKNTTIKEHNRINTQAFEIFWSEYPRKIGKGAALKAFQKASAKESPEIILDGLRAWIASGKMPEMQYIPHPTTWLNQARWTDDIEALVGSKNATSIAADIMNRAAAMDSYSQRRIE